MSVRFQGSDSIQTSTVNQEIIPDPPANHNWIVKFKFRSFSFFNETDCTVKINGGQPIFVRANQGLYFEDPIDEKIESFVIVEAGVKFNWAASF